MKNHFVCFLILLFILYSIIIEFNHKLIIIIFRYLLKYNVKKY